MRKSRTKIRKENKGNKYLLIFLFIIILPVISVVPGYFGSKYLITPRLFSEVNTNDKENLETETPTKPAENPPVIKKEETEEVSETKKSFDKSMDLVGFDFYSIQVGSFSNSENANELVKDLKEKSMGHHIYERDGFKVITTSLMDRSQADTLLASIRKSYEGCFIIATSIPNKKIEFNGEETEKVQLFNSNNDKLIKNLKELSNATFALETDALTIEEYKFLLKNFNTDISEIIRTLEALEVSIDFKPIYSNYAELLNNISKNTELVINGPGETLLLSGKNLLSTSLFNYLEFASSIY